MYRLYHVCFSLVVINPSLDKPSWKTTCCCDSSAWIKPPGIPQLFVVAPLHGTRICIQLECNETLLEAFKFLALESIRPSSGTQDPWIMFTAILAWIDNETSGEICLTPWICLHNFKCSVSWLHYRRFSSVVKFLAPVSSTTSVTN